MNSLQFWKNIQKTKISFCFIILFGIIAACVDQESNLINHDLETLSKEFLAHKNLDKRTTFFEVYIDSNLILNGQFEDPQLKEEFLSYIEWKGEENIKITNPKFGLIANSVSNVRSEPKHSAELSTQYLMGQRVKILRKDKDWTYIQGPDMYLGWIDNGGIIQDDALISNWEKLEKDTVLVNETLAYYDPEMNPQSIASDLVFGNVVGKLDKAYVLPDGKKVMIPEDAFKKERYDSEVVAVIDKAMTLMGRPYLWGGTSTKGMDCSGFTRTCFMNAGYLLGRDASLQVSEGIEIDKNNQDIWRRGDLLFFGSYREDGSQRITHVGIHLGEGRMIHASGRVKIESLNPQHDDYSESRATALMRVKRIFEN